MKSTKQLSEKKLAEAKAEKARKKEAKLQKYRNLSPVDFLQRYTIPEASDYLRQSPAKTWQDIAAKKLRAIKDGGRTYVPGSAIAARSSIEAA